MEWPTIGGSSWNPYSIRSVFKFAEIKELTNLVSLNLRNNEITTISSQILHLRKLESLDLSGNKIVDFQREIASMNNLTYLNLSNNQLKTLPIEIKTLVVVVALANTSVWRIK